MARWRRRSEQSIDDAEVPCPQAWSGAGLHAEQVAVPARRGRSVPGVQLRAGSVVTSVRVDELREFVGGKVGIVESTGEGPLTFLATVAAAAPSSVVGPRVLGLAPDSVVLLPADSSTPPAAVLDASVFADFARWVNALPS